MPSPDEIVLLQSENMTNESDGGGRAVGVTVDHNTQDLFNDITRTDRASGAVEMKKLWMAVRSANTDMVGDGHVIITSQPEDPRVNVMAVSTGRHDDRRADAADYAESWSIPSVEAPFFLYGRHLKSTRTLLVLQTEDRNPPEVGESYVLYDEGTGLTEFVRVLDVELTVQWFYPYNDTSRGRLRLRQCILSLSADLQHEWDGSRPNAAGSETGKAKLLFTQASNSARYYGVCGLSAVAAPGEKTVYLDDIYQPVVPSAVDEKNQVNIKAGTPGTLLVDTSVNTLERSGVVSLTAGQEFQFHIGCPVASVPSFKVDTSSFQVTDAVDGEMLGSATGVSKVLFDAVNGVFTLVASSTREVTVTAQVLPAVNVTELAFTHYIEIDEGNRGYAFSPILSPVPHPKTLTISYMVQGKWYVISDKNGNGVLEGEGGGNIDYVNGALALTLQRLPDVDTPIVISWSDSTSYDPVVSGGASAEALGHEFGKTIKPGTLVLSWTDETDTARQLADDGNGALVGDGAGKVAYSSGQVYFAQGFAGATVTADYTTYYNGVDGNDVEQVVIPFSVSGVSGAEKATATYTDSLLMQGAGLRYSYRFQRGRSDGSIEDVDASKVVYVGGTGGTDAGGSYQHLFVTKGFAALGSEFNTSDYVQQALGKYYPGSGHIELTVGGTYDVKRFDTVGNNWVSVGTGYYTFPASSFTASKLKEANGETVVSEAFNVDQVTIDIDVGRLDDLMPNSLVFGWRGSVYYDRDGSLFKDPGVLNNVGELVGAVDYSARRVTLTQAPTGTGTELVVYSAATIRGVKGTQSLAFRTIGAPVVSEKFTVRVKALDGTEETVVSDGVGAISGSIVTGFINYPIGFVRLTFNKDVNPNDVSYNATIGSLLPLNPDIIGLNPVRLPPDGLVPVMRDGQMVVLSHTRKTEVTPVAGQVVTLARDHQAVIYVEDANGVRLDPAQYLPDLVAGTVTWSDPLTLQDAQGGAVTAPFFVVDRVEDMTVAIDVQISGKVTIQDELTHDYPAGSVCSSVLWFGDLFARAYNPFERNIWDSDWSDVHPGDEPASASYNFLDFPVQVTNQGAITEKWALVFTSSTNFDIVGETLGVIGSATTTSGAAPVNANEGVPYFTIALEGFNTGWAAGNVIRFNTEGAQAPFWLIRAVSPGPATNDKDHVELMHRGG